jgi:hypothetical protein
MMKFHPIGIVPMGWNSFDEAKPPSVIDTAQSVFATLSKISPILDPTVIIRSQSSAKISPKWSAAAVPGR